MKSPLDSNHLGGIDLHIHSTASDGTCAPSELLQMAAGLGLQAIAITDHDTLEGIRAALGGALPEHLRLLSGVEISTKAPDGFPMGGSLHILGYGVDVNDAPLQQALDELKQARDSRIPRIIERLNHVGVPVTMQQVMEQVGQGNPGRPHVARAMILAGVVADINEAFDRFLSKGQPAYVDKYRIPCRRALDLIHGAGGVAVLAHPYLVPGGRGEALTPFVEHLCSIGLAGIEIYYPQHTPQDVALYLEVARRFDLLMTGGTDFHGELSPGIQMGRGKGDLHIPFAIYEALIAKIAQQKTH